MIQSLLQDLIRNISGSLGIRLRRWYYTSRFKVCGKNLVISEGVYFDRPSNISLGTNVWIDKQCIFISGKLQRKNIKIIQEPNKEGEIVIGDNAHIGIRTVLQAHGGIEIGDYFTSGTDSKLYTLSNDVYLTKKGTHCVNREEIFHILRPIQIGSNVWLGMQSIVIGGVIGDDVFIKANSISTCNIQSNSIADGNPTAVIKKRFN